MGPGGVKVCKMNGKAAAAGKREETNGNLGKQLREEHKERIGAGRETEFQTSLTVKVAQKSSNNYYP